MKTSFSKTRMRKFTTIAVLAFAPWVARAELVWTPEQGWHVQGGVAADLAQTTERKTALDLMNAARAAQEQEHWFSALGYYNDVIDEFPGTDFAAEAYFQKGVIHLHRNQFERSFNDFHDIIEKHPDFPRYGQVVQGQYDVAMAIKRGERPWLWGWIPWFKDNEKALEFFEKTYAAAPYGPRAELSLYEKGAWAREIDKEDEAIDAYERLVYRYPDSILTPRSYIAMAELYAGRVMGPHWDQGSTREALNFYRDFVALFPHDDYAPTAQKKVVELKDTLARNRLELGKFYYYRRNNGRAAAIFFNEAVNAAPKSEAAAEAQELLAKVRADEAPPRTLLDWIFGRYPKSDAGDFVDAQSQQNLDTMGFRATHRAEDDSTAADAAAKQP
jgi:outer membrane protein assembly factor BamD